MENAKNNDLLNYSGFSTKAIHTPFDKKDSHGALNMPIYNTVAFEFESVNDLEQAFLGRKPAHAYTRITNPSVEHFEQKVRNVTDSFSVIALASGMASISNLMLSVLESGDGILTSRHLFGNTFSLFTKTLSSFNIQTVFADLTDKEDVEKKISKKTRVIYFETISNPQMEVADIEMLSDIAKKHKLLLVADTTLTPPYLFDSRKFGVDIETLSSTKIISGGGTSVGGLIIDNGTYNWENIPKLKDEAKRFGPFALINKLRKEIFRNIGACLSPQNAFLQSLGLETLALRAEKSCDNCLKLATYLEKNEKVVSVNYPGLESSEFYEISRKQFLRSGSLFTFDLESKESCFKFMDKLQIIRRATNLQENKTLVLHPESTIYCEFSKELKDKMNIRDTMIRITVGIEDHPDLINDIEQALNKI